jgi:hypothetical protein
MIEHLPAMLEAGTPLLQSPVAEALEKANTKPDALTLISLAIPDDEKAA